MERSTLYNELSKSILQKWRKQLEDEEDYNSVTEKELKDELKTQLNGNNMDLFMSYCLAIENKKDDLLYNLNIKILNLGIKIGMELKKAFIEFED